MERIGGFLGLRSLRDINTSDDPVVSWVIEDTVPADGVGALVSNSGVGKSMMAHHFGACVVSGEKVFGVLAVKQGAVAYIDTDMHREKIAAMRATAALRGVGISVADVNDYPYYITGLHDSMDLREQETCDAVIADLRCIPDLVLVIFDVYSDLHRGKEGNPDDMTDVGRSLARIAATLHIGVVALHHLRKGGGSELEDIRGTTAIVAKLDAAFILTSEREDDDTQGIITMVQRKARLTEPAAPRYLDFSMEMDEQKQLRSFRFVPVKRGEKRGRPAAASEAARAIADAVLAQQPTLSKRELISALTERGTAATTAWRVAGEVFSKNPPPPRVPPLLEKTVPVAAQGKSPSHAPGANGREERDLWNAPADADDERAYSGERLSE